MEMKLLALIACLVLGALVAQVSADFSDGATCRHSSEENCNYCCVYENGYTGYKWKKYGGIGFGKKTCVCTGPSGSKVPAHRNDYNPGPPSPYVPSDPMEQYYYHYGNE